jgi:hypothetical protein
MGIKVSLSILCLSVLLVSCNSQQKNMSRAAASTSVCDEYLQAVCAETQSSIDSLISMRTSLQQRTGGQWQYSEVGNRVYAEYEGYTTLGRGSQYVAPRCRRLAAEQEGTAVSILGRADNLNSINTAKVHDIKSTAERVMKIRIVEIGRAVPLEAIEQDISILQEAMRITGCP